VTPGPITVGVALALDALVGEPPRRVHPVAWFGRAVAPLDREWRRPVLAGALAALALPAAAAALAGGFVVVAAGWRPPAGGVLAGGVLFVTTSLRRLLSVAGGVTAASERDLLRARESLRALAGRDAGALSAGQVRSAVVESLAENLADGLVAPLGAFAAGVAVGGLPPVVALAPFPPAALALGGGAAGACWVKAVNTMDSMLGYRSKPVGRAPARLDDAVMWVPARVTAVLLAAVWLAPGAPVRARRWLADVPSPNSGWPMGTAAAAMDRRLVKPGVYDLNPGGDLPTVADAERARYRVGVAGVVAYLLAGVSTL
jgi:adenosylcobinamide-phosphate synthase